MDGLVLVARAHSARKDWQGVVGILAAAEQACSDAAAAAAEAGAAASAVAADTGRSGSGGGGVVDGLHPPAELYEVVARSLAMAGMWEEAAGAVRRLEVRIYRPLRWSIGCPRMLLALILEFESHRGEILDLVAKIEEEFNC